MALLCAGIGAAELVTTFATIWPPRYVGATLRLNFFAKRKTAARNLETWHSNRIRTYPPETRQSAIDPKADIQYPRKFW